MNRRRSVDVLRNPITMSQSRPVVPTGVTRAGTPEAEVLADLDIPPLD